MRDDFSKSVKRIVAERVGYRCSKPDCRTLTTGPQDNPTKSLNIGVAAHISAASVGGPRYDPSLTTERRKHHENAIWLCQNCAKLIDNDPQKYPIEVLKIWKTRAEKQTSKLLGKPISLSIERDQSPADEIKRNLELKKRMENDFLKPNRQFINGKYHSYNKFHHQNFVIHSVEDTSYPDVDLSDTISGWFRVEPWDFYSNGLEIVLSLVRGMVNDNGGWALGERDDTFTKSNFTEINIWVIGRIPWRNIVTYDLHGDEYYREPHIYCYFNINGTPYEDIVYYMQSDDYDWPLKSEHRINVSSQTAKNGKI